MIKEFLAEAVIRSAITFEDDSHAFYKRSMELESDPRLKELFGRLAEEEVQHHRKLESLLASRLKAVLEIEEGRLPDVIVPSEEEVPGGSGPPRDALDVLKRALEHEVSSHNFYTLLGKRSVLPILKKTFAFLAAEEEGHVRRVREMIEELKKGKSR